MHSKHRVIIIIVLNYRKRAGYIFCMITLLEACRSYEFHLMNMLTIKELYWLAFMRISIG